MELDKIVVTSDVTLRDAMRAIDNGACEVALVVDDQRRLMGTLTDGDVRRALLRGADFGDSAARFMNPAYTAVGPDSGRAEVLDLMKARFLRQIPVVDKQGRLVGVHLLREMIGAVSRENWAVVMAGGRGERLRPLTDSLPKPMLKVAGRPILERIVLHLVGYGITRIFLSVNYMAEVIERHFEDGSRFGCRIQYLHESTPLGTGGALSLLPALPMRPLIVLNGDLVTEVDLASMLRFHETGGYVATMGVRQCVHTVPYGVVSAERGAVREIHEKPTYSWLVNAGVYVLEPGLLSRVPRETFFSLPTLVEQCLDRGERVGPFRIHEDWADVGQHDELKRARGEVS